MKYSSDTWGLELPDDWIVDEAEDMMSFYSPDETRSLHISDYFKDDGDVTLDDIRELSEIETFEKTNLPFLHGVKHRQVEEDEAVVGWWLHMKNHLIFVEYVCLVEQEPNLVSEIEGMIYSLKSFHC